MDTNVQNARCAFVREGKDKINANMRASSFLFI